MKILFSLATLFLLTSCASMNLEKCKSANWEVYGQSDASSRHANLFDQYAEECREFGVTPNRAQYEAGFKRGLDELCTFQNGYLIGNEGAELPRICPKEIQDKFVQGFIEGQRNYDMKKQMEKQNELVEKAMELNNKNKIKSCEYNYECGPNGHCFQGHCHY
ncbi:MAG: DUF2799 domain-containing protein [Bacteriovorax sp.]